MKIHNRTRYPTRVLGALIRRVVRDVAVTMSRFEPGELDTLPGRHTRAQVGPAAWQRRDAILSGLAISIVRLPGNEVGYGGWAYTSGHEAKLRIPGATMELDRFLALVRHEVWHLFGVGGHRAFPDAINRCAPEPIRELYRDLLSKLGNQVVEEAPRAARRAPGVDLAQAKLARLLDRQQAWEARQRRANRALAKIARSVRYYQGRLAARTVPIRRKGVPNGNP